MYLTDVIGVLALIVALIGVYYTYKSYQLSRENEGRINMLEKSIVEFRGDKNIVTTKQHGDNYSL